MNWLLIVAILLICAAPLYAQGAQPDTAKLKADAQKVVSIIGGDKAKAQAYCQILDLGDQLDQVDEEKDPKKAEDLSQKIDELEKTLGPEYLALATRSVLTGRTLEPARMVYRILFGDNLLRLSTSARPHRKRADPAMQQR